MIEEADYVVVSGGSAGCVMAARLSEDPHNLEVGLHSAEPLAKPKIEFRMYDGHADIEAMIKAVKCANPIYDMSSLARHVSGTAYLPNPRQSDAEWEAQIRGCSLVVFHPVGTCRMGGDTAWVVDPQLRARRRRAARRRRFDHARAAVGQHQCPRDHDQ